MNAGWRHRLGQAWNEISDGWEELAERARGALTRFSSHRPGAVQTREERLAGQGARWSLLAAELRDAGETLEVRLEVPGMEPEDFDVQVQGDVLIVRGEKRVERDRHEGQWYLMERAYGSFERVVPLPVEVDEAGVQAHYRRGVLRLTLPKTEQRQRRRITVATE